jgi:lipopolysaccharide export system protein LptA
MIPYMREQYGNPASRSHSLGWTAEQAVEQARQDVADLVGADPREIVWTSGATESNNLAIKGAANFYKDARNLELMIKGQRAKRADQVTIPHMVKASAFVKRASLVTRGLTYDRNSAKKIDEIFGEGGVSISQGEGTATGAALHYPLESGFATLSGDVEVREGPSTFTGDRATFNVETGNSVLEGSVKAVFIPDARIP